LWVIAVEFELTAMQQGFFATCWPASARGKTNLLAHQLALHNLPFYCILLLNSTG
jgi:hypothetical protein